MIDIHYSDSGGTNNMNMNFSFVTRMSIPIAKRPSLQAPELAFCADGTKFAMAIGSGRVSVWDIRSNILLKTFMALKSDYGGRFVSHLQFSSGKSGKEVLVFSEVCLISPSGIPSSHK